MSSFLFTAVDKNEKSITDRVEAENLSQAKYKLEIRGYSEIVFYESELSDDVINLFDEKSKGNREKFLERQVEIQYNTNCWLSVWKNLKITLFAWLILVAWVYLSSSPLSYFVLGTAILGFTYINLPMIFYHYLVEAHTWGQNSKVRFWAKAARFFNYVSFLKIPAVDIDFRLACAEAREGNLNDALSRMSKYRDDEKISERLLNVYLGSIYNSAERFDKFLELREKSLYEGNIQSEEILDYAICLARRFKKTQQAKSILEKVFDNEVSYLALMAIPYCQGVIEVEEENLSQAEFYLRQAQKQIEPFRKNSYLVGLRSEIKAFLAIVLGKRGEKEEAAKLFGEAKPYLLAHKSTELLQRCEEAVS